MSLRQETGRAVAGAPTQMRVLQEQKRPFMPLSGSSVHLPVDSSRANAGKGGPPSLVNCLSIGMVLCEPC
jgi:hypothetical protein